MPRILVTMDLDPAYDGLRLRRDYVRRLRNAGGLPLLLPQAERGLTELDAAECLRGCHGLLLTGGGDLEPWRYGASPGPDRDVDPERDEAELALCGAAVRLGLPVFGICRGLQVLNVALGGDIYQDLDAAWPQGGSSHCFPSSVRYGRQHGLTVIRPELARLIGCHPLVNSHHHQGLRRIAPQLQPAAYAPDGLCEAVTGREGRPLLGVQWHPECLDDMSPLFDAFVAQCQIFAAGDRLS